MTFREALDGTTFYDTWIGAWNAGNVKCAYHKMFMSWATRRRSEDQAQQGAQQRQQPRNAESGSSASSPAVPLCTICAVASVDSIYVSCGHACVCRDCAAISAAYHPYAFTHSMSTWYVDQVGRVWGIATSWATLAAASAASKRSLSIVVSASLSLAFVSSRSRASESLLSCSGLPLSLA